MNCQCCDSEPCLEALDNAMDSYVKHCASKGQIVIMDDYFMSSPLDMYKGML